MMVTFVSQCEKNALKKTRRVLDAFANRIGDNTWQTLITEDGLFTVKKMLRQTASKSTAVSCHWTRSRSQSQLLWIVGNKRQFNAQGHVPVNRTESDLLTNDHASNWKYLPLIKAFSALAALLHDWGKASQLFQEKLNPASKNKFKGDPLRHEWISTLLFCALVKTSELPGDDKGWIDQLLNRFLDEKKLKEFVQQMRGESAPLADLPNAAALLVWLIVSHHRLPLLKDTSQFEDRTNANVQALLKKITHEWGYENRFDEAEYQKRIEKCFEFPEGLISGSEVWLQRLSFWAQQLNANLHLFTSAVEDGSWRSIAHHARLCVMLGDHYYSSQDSAPNWQKSVDLFANTGRDSENQVFLKQRLDEHLVGVSEVAVRTAELLPHFENDPPLAMEIDSLKPKQKTSKKFRWQDKAVTAIRAFRQEHEDRVQGFFVVNMASTGRGKTLANAKVMQALSEDQESLRYILALGLRTLTLQTGDEYRKRIGLNDDQLAVLIGSKAVLELHKGQATPQEVDEMENSTFEALGSESEDPLLDPQEELRWGYKDEGWQEILPEEELTTVLKGAKERALLYAPVLACTIDHIITATETKRGGRYILPCLRLMSSDLVIDEIDDFTGGDLIAIGRLVHLAGMLGRKVMISSATIPPDLALGLFSAYQQGWCVHAASRNVSSQVGCAWIDEFKTHVTSISHGQAIPRDYDAHHQAFVAERVSKLKDQIVKHKAEIVRLPEKNEELGVREQYFQAIQQAITTKHHQHHTTDSETGRQVSFGVVRCANIPLCIDLTEYLLDANWPMDTEVRAMAYHSQQVLVLRHAQEQHLDAVLKRNELAGEVPEAFNNSIIRDHLDSAEHPNIIFVLIATPVEEVGRDHDFDWAVIEPSSYRSIIQMAGRVRRHRELDQDIATPNIAILQYNWKAYKGDSHPVFTRPGYETNILKLSTKNLFELVDEKQLLRAVSAKPRIQRADELKPSTSLADLEHCSTSKTFCCSYLLGEIEVQTQAKRSRRSRKANSDPSTCAKQLWGYTQDYWWMTALSQQFNRFRSSDPSINLSLVISDAGEQTFQTYDSQNFEWVPIEKRFGIIHQSVSASSRKRLWMSRDYETLIDQWGERLDLAPTTTSKRFGELSLSHHSEGNRYRYSDDLGLIKIRDDQP